MLKLGGIALGSLAAICCNPLGWHLPAYALMLVGSPITHFIVEWRATGLDDPGFTYGALPLLALVICAGVGWPPAAPRVRARVGKRFWSRPHSSG